MLATNAAFLAIALALAAGMTAAVLVLGAAYWWEDNDD